jgi:integration host factor subunit beta
VQARKAGRGSDVMGTITKKELIDRIAEKSQIKRGDVKRIVQMFLDAIIDDLGNGNRLEFRDFGVFEIKVRKPRQAQNPKTLEPVAVPARRTVKFKVGRLMKQQLLGLPTQPMEVVIVAAPDGKKSTAGGAGGGTRRSSKERERAPRSA